MSYTNDRASDELNRAAAHDTSLYDESAHDNHIVAMYDTDVQAKSAKDLLVQNGVAADTIQTIYKAADKGVLGGVNAEDENGGVWGVLRALFLGNSSHDAYTHAVGRGHAMVVVTPAQGVDRQALVRLIATTEPVDFDAKLEEWRQAGYDHSAPHEDYTRVMESPVARMADNDPVVQGKVPSPMADARAEQPAVPNPSPKSYM